MRNYSQGGNGLYGWRGSSLEGDGPLEAYARDNNGAPCEFTWISCVTEGYPRNRPGSGGNTRPYIQARVDLDIARSGDADAGANIGFYMKRYDDAGNLIGYITILQISPSSTTHYTYSNWGGEYPAYNYYAPEICMRNWVQNYGGQTGDFWSIAYRGIEPSGDLWYNYFYAKLYNV